MRCYLPDSSTMADTHSNVNGTSGGGGKQNIQGEDEAAEGWEPDPSGRGTAEIPGKHNEDAGCEVDFELLSVAKLYGEKKYAVALTEAYRVTQQHPVCIDGYIWCGKILVKLGRFEDALNAYRRGLDIDPNHKTIVTDLKKMQTDILAARETGGKELEDDYNALKLCSQDPYPGDDELLLLEAEIIDKKRLNDVPALTDETPCLENRGEAGAWARKLRKDGDTEAALVCYGTALQVDPNNPELWKEKAEILFGRGQYKEALLCCNAVVQGMRTAEVWKMGGKILRELGFPVTAESWLRKASKLSTGKDEEAAILFQQVRVQRLYGPLINGFPIKVDFTQYGRAIRSSGVIRKGEMVFADAPLVLAQTLDSLNIPACSYCAKNLLRPEDYFTGGEIARDPVLKKAVLSFWPEVKKLPCEFCCHELYCSNKCRKEAWVRHHSILCPTKNQAAEKLYEVCDQYTGAVSGAMGAWSGVWNASFSPMVLARIWASIISQAKQQAKEDGLLRPTNDHWSKAMSPFRRFIAYGSSSNAKVIPKMHHIMAEVFRDCGDGLSYDITQREFDGRYFQATCNVQAFSDPEPPLKVFVDKVKATSKGNYIMGLLTNGQPEAVFAGMFSLHACINHSCDNNVEIMDAMVEGAVGVKVRAKKPLKKDEELFTTYIDTRLPRRERRAWLRRAYNFWCNCDRCTYEGDGPEACTNCGAPAESDKKLPTCGKCHRAWYCSGKCQKEAWKKGHKRICKNWS